jgi:hypothetical protein
MIPPGVKWAALGLAREKATAVPTATVSKIDVKSAD